MKSSFETAENFSYRFRVFVSLSQERGPLLLALKVSRQGLSGCAEVRHSHNNTRTQHTQQRRTHNRHNRDAHVNTHIHRHTGIHMQ